MKRLAVRLQKSGIHYAWIILICCCMINGACLGTIINCKGIFISPVISDMAWTSTRFTLYLAFYGISSAVLLPLVPRIFEKYSLKKVLFVSLFVLCSATSAMGTFTTLYQWYIAGALQGISGAFILFVPVSYLINQWFRDKKGTAQGIAAAFSGIMGVIMNLVLGKIITVLGWRTAYIIQGSFAFLMALPFILLIIKRPADAGICAYGAEMPENESSESVKIERGIGGNQQHLFTICFMLTVLSSFCTAYAQHLSNYAVTIGSPLSYGAGLVSAAMAGNVISKFLLGVFRDKFGTEKTWIVSLTFSSAAFIMLMLGRHFSLLNSAGAFLLGLVSANLSVLIPLSLSDRFSSNAFQAKFAHVTMGTMFTGAFSTTGISLMYDLSGSYLLAFASGLTMQLCCILLVKLYYRW